MTSVSVISVVVSMGKDTFDIHIPEEATGKSLMEEIEKVTGVMTRMQKLIFKGKVVDTKAPLKASKILQGSKLMLLVTGGAAPTRHVQPAKVSAADAQLKLAKAAASQAHLKRSSMQQNAQPVPTGSLQDRIKVWQKTGFVALRDLDLDALPDSLSAISDAVRVLDATNNRLTAVPPLLASLKNLQSLRLSHNQISISTPTSTSPDPDFSTPDSNHKSVVQETVISTLDSNQGSNSNHQDPVAAAFAGLTALTTLVLDSNALETLRGVLQPGLSRLAALSARGNVIATLPENLSFLQKLRVLNLSHNRLTELPESLGSLCCLGELQATNNMLVALPDSTSCLKSLRTLQLDDNRLKAIPPGVLSDCESLVTLTLHNNPISLEDLRNTPGFSDYDKRRVAKCDKQMEMSVMLDIERSFNEGADVPMWEHYSKFNK